MSLTPDQETLMAERYGVKRRSPQRKRLQAWAALAGVLTMAAVTWWFSAANFNPVSYSVVGFEVVNDWQLNLEFEIQAPAGTDLSCDLQALDASYGVVGHKTVSLAGVDGEVARYSVNMRTSAKAVTGVVEICRSK